MPTETADEIRLTREDDKRTIFILDRMSGRYRAVVQESPWQHGAAGVAIEWKVNLWRHETVLLALFAHHNTLICRVGSQEFDLRHPDTRAHVDALLFVNRFQIGHADISVSHWYFPDLLGGLDDLPEFIAKLSRDRAESLRTLLRYQASAAGRNVLDPAVYRELEVEFARLSSITSDNRQPH